MATMCTVVCIQCVTFPIVGTCRFLSAISKDVQSNLNELSNEFAINGIRLYLTPKKRLKSKLKLNEIIKFHSDSLG